MQIGLVLGASIVAFASTNVDDIFVLIAFMSDRRYRTPQVIAGQYLGIGSITLMSGLAATQAFRLPSGSVHLLGILPFMIGLKQLWALRKDDTTIVKVEKASGVLTVALVTVANGADNVAVYVPLFAKLGLSSFPVVALVFATLTGVWCVAARWCLTHKIISTHIDKLGNRITPIILIVLGIYVFVTA